MWRASPGHGADVQGVQGSKPGSGGVSFIVNLHFPPSPIIISVAGGRQGVTVMVAWMTIMSCIGSSNVVNSEGEHNKTYMCEFSGDSFKVHYYWLRWEFSGIGWHCGNLASWIMSTFICQRQLIPMQMKYEHTFSLCFSELYEELSSKTAYVHITCFSFSFL